MYRKSNQPELTPSKFQLPVVVELSSDNRWVIMAELIPWSGTRAFTDKPHNALAEETLSEGVPQGDTAISEGVSFRTHISFRTAGSLVNLSQNMQKSLGEMGQKYRPSKMVETLI